MRSKANITFNKRIYYLLSVGAIILLYSLLPQKKKLYFNVEIQNLKVNLH
jgi:hypothetical protein